jgi:hypothetical protein
VFVSDVVAALREEADQEPRGFLRKALSFAGGTAFDRWMYLNYAADFVKERFSQALAQVEERKR